MPAKTQVSKMPVGKMQFGIIVPVALHKKVKNLATDEEVRISDIYARGAEMALDAKNMGLGGSREVELVKYVAKDLDKASWPLLRALGDFIRSGPSKDQMDMLKLLLGKYLPDEFARPRLAKVNG